ncbi:MAG: ligand-binding protein SH3 [Methanobacteriota archaeon]|nr:MAG: ligand-binding protein SH3 [Euryarchaeota archaeon]
MLLDNHLVVVAVISVLPFVELRGAIPYGLCVGANPVGVFMVAAIMNILLVPILVVSLESAYRWVLGTRLANLCEFYVNRTRRAANPYVDRYGFLGLLIFVAIPLPGTGAYTGSLAAFLMGLDRRRSTLAISLGVLLAGTMVFIITYLGIGFLSYFLHLTPCKAFNTQLSPG